MQNDTTLTSNIEAVTQESRRLAAAITRDAYGFGRRFPAAHPLTVDVHRRIHQSHACNPKRAREVHSALARVGS